MKQAVISVLAALLLAGIIACPAAAETAAPVPLIPLHAGGEPIPSLTDGDYETIELFGSGSTIYLAPKKLGQQFYGLYLIWAAPPASWSITIGNTTTEQGWNGFLHEFIPIPQGAPSAILHFPKGEALCDVRAYGAGDLPGDVQVWEPPCEKADLLLFPAHADDEILFFGGILAEYAGQRQLKTQVAYFSQYNNIREHEKLDGLWACGVRNYPVNAPFPDRMPQTPRDARKLFGEEAATEFFVQQLRRFQPQVCIGHDVDGEYGHETHKFTAAILRKALTVSADARRYPDSAAQYGVWDVPKAYLHLWKHNPIRLDCRTPLSAFGGQTALEVAKAAYTKHVSQQWCWFYVSDDNEYSIADFGLYRTTVGRDSENDLMEHLTPYGS